MILSSSSSLSETESRFNLPLMALAISGVESAGLRKAGEGLAEFSSNAWRGPFFDIGRTSPLPTNEGSLDDTRLWPESGGRIKDGNEAKAPSLFA